MKQKHLIKSHLPAFGLLLIAFALRVYLLDRLPPGLTHDEANHGHEALELLSGVYRYYFPLGYGREPLYAYLLASWMRLIGVSIFSLRLLIPMGMIICYAVVYRWVYTAFCRHTALITLAILAVAWWPLVASRQALRSGLLPLITIGLVGATYTIWQKASADQSFAKFWRSVRWPMISIAILIGLMLHTYIAARVLWVFIPAFGIYIFLLSKLDRHTPLDSQNVVRFWLASFPAIIGGLLLSAPLFIYLRSNPGLETRLDMLDGPLQALRTGDIVPILKNVWGTILGLIWPGQGDKFLAYNIPGKQTLAPLTALFFVIGVGNTVFNWRKPKYILLLLWLGVGLAPSLITGPTAATTRSIGALIPIYVLAALGIQALNNYFVYFAEKKNLSLSLSLPIVLTAIWVGSAALFSLPAYFSEWGQQPDVRAAYQATMIDALESAPLKQTTSGQMVSSVLPGHAHDPTIAEMIVPAQQLADLYWADGRFALIVPAEVDQLQIIAPASADLHPVFKAFMIEQSVTNMRPDDLDPFWTHYQLSVPESANHEALANLGDAIELNSARWLAETVPSNGVAELLTTWTVLDPKNLGNTIPYVGHPDTNIFVHILQPDGTILSQADQLNAPSWQWQEGDRIYQVHKIYIPADTKEADYDSVTGVYDRLTGNRLAVSGSDETTIQLPPLQIRN